MSADLENRLNRQWSIWLQNADKANNQPDAYFYIIIHCGRRALPPDEQPMGGRRRWLRAARGARSKMQSCGKGS